MYTGLLHAHSGLRWVALVLLVTAVFAAFRGFSSDKAFTESDRKLGLYALVSVHLQLLLGLALYFTSPKVEFSAAVMKDAVGRFFTVEHLTLMLIAIALITVGYSRAKRAATDKAKFRAILIFFGIGLLLILVSIPWPFRIPGSGWF